MCIWVFWTTRIACLRKDRLNLSCGDSHYNAYGLQTPWILEWNEDFFCRQLQRRFWREDFHRLVLNRPYFGTFAIVSRVHHHFFGTGRTIEPFAVAGIERFSVKH
jgi:hypothetical protein